MTKIEREIAKKELKDSAAFNLGGLIDYFNKEEIIAKDLDDENRLEKVYEIQKILNELKILYEQI